MDFAVTFALLSLLSSGVIDIVFKFYSGKDRSRGAYVFGTGVTWTALQAIAVAAQGDAFVFDRTSVGFGLAAGLFLTLGNILLLESFAHIDVSLGSTIYRLNTVGVVILSFLFLGESLGGLKVLGVLCGVAGMLLLYRRGRSPEHDGWFLLFFAAAVVASILRATFGVVSKAGISMGADFDTMLLLNAVCWIFGGAAYGLIREKNFGFDRKILAYSLLSGVLAFFRAPLRIGELPEDIV